jgi:hypothetical protein
MSDHTLRKPLAQLGLSAAFLATTLALFANFCLGC